MLVSDDSRDETEGLEFRRLSSIALFLGFRRAEVTAQSRFCAWSNPEVFTHQAGCQRVIHARGWPCQQSVRAKCDESHREGVSSDVSSGLSDVGEAGNVGWLVRCLFAEKVWLAERFVRTRLDKLHLRGVHVSLR